MRFFRLIALAMLLPFFGGCHLLTGHRAAPADAALFVEDPDAVPGESDPVWIRNARLAGNRLVLEVQYSGGCADHDFTLYGDAHWTRSLPPQTVVRLVHDANGDACEALITEDLRFDLRPLKQDWRQRFDYRGTVRIGIVAAHADTVSFFVETTL